MSGQKAARTSCCWNPALNVYRLVDSQSNSWEKSDLDVLHCFANSKLKLHHFSKNEERNQIAHFKQIDQQIWYTEMSEALCRLLWATERTLSISVSWSVVFRGARRAWSYWKHQADGHSTSSVQDILWWYILWYSVTMCYNIFQKCVIVYIESWLRPISPCFLPLGLELLLYPCHSDGKEFVKLLSQDWIKPEMIQDVNDCPPKWSEMIWNESPWWSMVTVVDVITSLLLRCWVEVVVEAIELLLGMGCASTGLQWSVLRCQGNMNGL